MVDIDFVGLAVEWLSNLFSNVTFFVNNGFPHLMGLFGGVPVVGELLGNVSNFELVVIVFFGFLLFYFLKVKTIIEWLKILFVLFVVLVVFGVVNV